VLRVEDAVEETLRAAELGFRSIFLPNKPAADVPDLNDDCWKPLWAAAEEANMVLTFHIGNEPADLVAHRGPGGAVMNWIEASWGGQRAAFKLVSCGALDQHPNLKVLISEGGASWVPFLGDRMDEAYRQLGTFVRPRLSLTPKELLYRQVYASFQHDVSAVPALTAMGYQNVIWGSDYPHVEGTFGHTQETLHELFDNEPEAVRRRITVETFLELFPEVGIPPVGNLDQLQTVGR
jgi:predicted TIM-barrel fold metal-dependent hydrolase